MSNKRDYDKIISSLFMEKYQEQSEANEIHFTLDDIRNKARQLYNSKEIKTSLDNPPDLPYTYRTRAPLPKSILATGNWIIEAKGKGKYAFVKIQRTPFIEIIEGLSEIEILNATPEIVEEYSLNDEQGLCSQIRYNRLVDVFTELSCFHLQSHIRTSLEKRGQLEIDDLYIGLDKEGNKYIIPLEAKSASQRDKLGWAQISNMVRFARQYFPQLTCKPLATKPLDKNRIYLIEFTSEIDYEAIKIKEMKLYKLVRRPD